MTNFIKSTWNEFIGNNRQKETIRAGVIPFFYDGDTEYLIFSRPKKSNKLSDFGGGCKVRFNESSIACLSREVLEEGENMIYDLIEETLDYPEEFIYYNNNFENPQAITVFKRIKKYIEWFLLIPINLTYIEYLKNRTFFYPNKEISSIEIIDSNKLNQLYSPEISIIFDGSITNFIRYLYLYL